MVAFPTTTERPRSESVVVTPRQPVVDGTVHTRHNTVAPFLHSPLHNASVRLSVIGADSRGPGRLGDAAPARLASIRRCGRAYCSSYCPLAAAAACARSLSPCRYKSFIANLFTGVRRTLIIATCNIRGALYSTFRARNQSRAFPHALPVEVLPLLQLRLIVNADRYSGHRACVVRRLYFNRCQLSRYDRQCIEEAGNIH